MAHSIKLQKELASYVERLIEWLEIVDRDAAELMHEAVACATRQEKQHRAGGYGGRYVLPVKHTALLLVGRAFWHEMNYCTDAQGAVYALGRMRADLRNAVMASMLVTRGGHHNQAWADVCKICDHSPFTRYKMLADWSYARDVAGVE